MSAVESAMKALNLAKDPETWKAKKARVHMLMDEAERIKTSDNWSPSLVLPEASDFDHQEIDASTIKKLDEPVSKRTLTTAENILLLKASKLNGFKFPPWKGPPPGSDFEFRDGEQLFSYVLALLVTRESFTEHYMQ